MIGPFIKGNILRGKSKKKTILLENLDRQSDNELSRLDVGPSLKKNVIISETEKNEHQILVKIISYLN
jgi:hypothetical protein